MMETKNNGRDVRRRRAILQAARECFLQFGYAKTSLDDIARRANISRPLIYTKFKNKEEILAAIFEQVFEEQYPAAEQALSLPESKRERLFRVYEILLLEPWDEVTGTPMAAEFYEICASLLPQEFAQYEQRCLRYAQAILGSQELAEVFLLAVEGLQSDLPPTAVLRRRLQLLIERFVD